MKLYSSKLFVYLFIISWSFNLFAQYETADTLNVDEYFNGSVSLLNHSLVYLDSSKSKTILDIQSIDTRFYKRTDNGRMVIDQNYEDGYWLKFFIKNTSEKCNFQGTLYLGRQSIHNLYVFNNGLIDSLTTGGSINVDHRPFYNFSFLPIQVPPNKTYTFYLHPEADWGHVKSVDYAIQSYKYTLHQADEETPERYKYNFFQGLFLGIIVFVILFSFIQYVWERDKAYLAYIIYLIGILGYYCIVRASRLVIFSSHYVEEIILYNTPVSYFIFGTYLIFILVFLDINKKNHRYLYPTLLILISLSFLSILVDLIMRFTSQDSLFIDLHLYIRTIAIPIAIVVVFLLFKTMQKNRTAVFILTGTLLIIFFGWASMFIGDIEQNLSSNIHDPKGEVFRLFLWTPISSSQVGILLDILCFSLGLSYRSKKRLQNAKQEKITANIARLESKKNALETKQAFAELERNAVELKLEKAILNQKVSSSELIALKAQIKPHFIGNALNSIKLLIQEGEKKKAVLYLSKFASLMRQILDNSKKQLIQLEQELFFCNLYLEIESLRFQDQFEYHIQIEKGLSIDDLKVPPLILQPYLENAIWHGLLTKGGERILYLSIIKKGSEVKCVIEDNGIGRKRAQLNKHKDKKNTSSYGINITNDRLNLSNELYETHFEVNIIDKKDSQGQALGTRVELIISK